MMKYPKFKDFAEEHPLDGDKKRLDDILNIEILVLAYKISKSKFKDKNYLTLQIEIENRKFVVFTGSNVLMDQAEKYADKMPFLATVVKSGNYYTMS